MVEDDYTTADAYADLIAAAYPNIPFKTQLYIDQWLHNGYAPEVADMILEMSTCEEGFKLLMQSPDIEKTLDYIYPDTQLAISKSSRARRVSAFKEPLQDRMNAAETYWHDMYEMYVERKGYFRVC